MFKLNTLLLFCLGAALALPGLQAQNLFRAIEAEQVNFGPKSIERPDHFSAFETDHDALQNIIETALSSDKTIPLPLPEGSLGQFKIDFYPVAEADFYKRFPNIHTFRITQLDGDYTGYGDLTAKGFHAALHGEGGLYYIDPTHLTIDQRNYVSYFVKDYSRDTELPVFECSTEEPVLEHNVQDPTIDDYRTIQSRSVQADSLPLRRYRLAASTTAEYSQFHGNTVESVADALASLVVRVNEIMRREYSIEYVLIGNTDTLFFFDRNNDGYTNGNTQALINEGAGIINSRIFVNDYDIGHVFCTNAGGLAQVSSICTRQGKARGVSCSFNPIGDGYYVSIVCHEIGHQMGSSHSFNFCRGQNESLASGYEPGSGSTIMAYAGLCGSRNTQTFTDPYYNIGSVESITNYMHNNFGASCAETIERANTPPVVNIPYEDGFFIPVSTPFELDGSATDAENQELFYCWEQHDSGLTNCEPGSAEGNCPLFRTFIPTTDSIRVFPEIADIVQGRNDRWESLPTYSRSLEFALTVRDWDPEGGALAWEFLQFNATEDAGPFTVGEVSGVYQVGEQVELNWDIANTDQEPVNCQFVDVYMSTDGGFNYPHLIATGIPNTGSVKLNMPNIPTNSGVFKVKASNNIFFNISDGEFRIETPSEPGFLAGLQPFAQQVCLPESGDFTITTEGYLNFAEDIFVAEVMGLPMDASFSTDLPSVQAGENMVLTIDFGDNPAEGIYDFEILLTSVTSDTLLLPARATLVSNDFSELAGTLPAQNAENVTELPTFKWVAVEDANTYTLEVASSPNFNAENIVFSEENISLDSILIDELLPKNSLLYWRVVPVNECGPGAPSPVYVFHTQAQDCNTYTSIDVPRIITTSGSARTSSELVIEEEGVISDVNVLNLRGGHQYIGELIAELESPGETKVILFDEDCFNNQDFRVTFDDQAPIELTCPLNQGRTNQPVGQLADFIGENTRGTWKINLRDNTPGFGGELQGWGLEICGSISIPKPDYSVDTMYVDKGGEQFITPQNLQASKDGLGEFDLLYTVVEGPKNGQLSHGSESIVPGSQFNQFAVNSYHLVYTHDNSDAIVDYITFTIEDGQGGWIGLDTLYIIVDPVLNNIQGHAIEFDVFPNPTDIEFTVRMPEAHRTGNIRVFNMQGQIVRERKLNGSLLYHFFSGDLPKGAYIVSVQDQKGQSVKQIIVQ